MPVTIIVKFAGQGRSCSFPYAGDLPDLSIEGDNIRGVPNELQRSWLVQTGCDLGKGTIWVILPSNRTRSTRLWCPLVTRNPSL